MTTKPSESCKIVTNRGYSLLKSSFDSNFLQDIKRELTVQPITHKDFPPLKPFGIYDESDKYLRLPIHWAVKKFGKPDINTLCFCPNSENIQFKGMLRSNQIEPVNNTIEYLQNNNRGI